MRRPKNAFFLTSGREVEIPVTRIHTGDILCVHNTSILLFSHNYDMIYPILLTEYVRHRLARTICSRLSDSEKRVHVVTLDPALEDRIAAGLEHNERGLFIRLSAQAVETTCSLIAAEIGKLAQGHHPPVVLVSPQIRPGLKQLTSANLPNLHVLSYNEITRDTRIESVGIVSDSFPRG